MATAGSSSESRGFIPIKQLSPYTQRWTIRARVLEKTPVVKFRSGTGQVLTVDLMDRQGDSIKAKFWNNSAEEYNKLLEPGNVYIFRGGRVQVADKRYNTLPHNYELIFDRSTADIRKVEGSQAEEAQAAIPAQRKAQFQKLRDIKQSNRELPFFTDFIGVVRSFRDKNTVSARRSLDGSSVTTESTARRVVSVVDDSEHEIEITLWGDWADISEEKLSDFPVIEFRNIQIREWRGRVGSTVRSSKVTIAPSIDETALMQEWWESKGREIGHFAPLMTETGMGRNDAGGGPVKDATLAEVFKEMQEMEQGDTRTYQVVAEPNRIFIANRNNEMAAFYMACPRCNKKVNEDLGSYRCEPCGATVEATARYMFGVGLVDNTASRFSCRCFNEAGKVFLGLDADAVRKFDVEGREVPVELRHIAEWKALWKPYRIRLRVRVDMFNGEPRRSAQVAAIEPLNYDTDAERLVREIRAMLPDASSYLSSKKHAGEDMASIEPRDGYKRRRQEDEGEKEREVGDVKRQRKEEEEGRTSDKENAEREVEG